jgi:hypothetical protein
MLDGRGDRGPAAAENPARVAQQQQSQGVRIALRHGFGRIDVGNVQQEPRGQFRGTALGGQGDRRPPQPVLDPVAGAVFQQGLDDGDVFPRNRDVQGRPPGGIGHVEQAGLVFEDSIHGGGIAALGRVQKLVGPGCAPSARQQGRYAQERSGRREAYGCT